MKERMTISDFLRSKGYPVDRKSRNVYYNKLLDTVRELGAYGEVKSKDGGPRYYYTVEDLETAFELCKEHMDAHRIFKKDGLEYCSMWKLRELVDVEHKEAYLKHVYAVVASGKIRTERLNGTRILAYCLQDVKKDLEAWKRERNDAQPALPLDTQREPAPSEDDEPHPSNEDEFTLRGQECLAVVDALATFGEVALKELNKSGLPFIVKSSLNSQAMFAMDLRKRIIAKCTYNEQKGDTNA